MSTDDDPVFCCKEARRVPPPPNYKPHHDPNRELHESIFRSFVRFALRKHQEADCLRLQEAERLEQCRVQGAQEILHRLRSLVDSGPSTPLSFPSTPVSLSPAQFYNAPLPELPQLPPLPESGLMAALQMPPKQQDPKPVLTIEELANNPLRPDSKYVVHITSRHDFGPVYAHRYYIYPDDMSDNWIEITKGQWFAHSINFNMKAEKFDLKCEIHARFFRMILKPNLTLRGRFPVPTPVSSKRAIQHYSSHRTNFKKQVPHTVASYGTETANREYWFPMSVSPEMKQASYTEPTYPMPGYGTEFVENEYSGPLFVPTPDMEQVSYAQTAYPMTNGGVNTVERKHSYPLFMHMSKGKGKQVSYPQAAYPGACGEVELVEREDPFPTFVPASAKQISYAQVAQMGYPMASGGLSYVERECLASILMPTPETKQVSYLVTSEGAENGLDLGAK